MVRADSHRDARSGPARSLTETLRTLRVARKAEALRRGWGRVPKWVFCTEDGGPLDGDNLRTRVFYKVLEKAELRAIRFHDLRHTFASLLIAQGVSLAYVRDQLGHSSIQLTVDTYGHLIPGTNRQAVDRLDDPKPVRGEAQNGRGHQPGKSAGQPAAGVQRATSSPPARPIE